MATLANLVIRIQANTDQMTAALNTAERRTKSFNDKLKALRGPALAITGALTGLGIVSIKTASDLEQSIGGVQSVFGEASERVLEFSKTTVDSMGLSQRAFNEAILPLAAMMKNAGVETNAMTDNVLQLSGVAADMAATFGGTTQEALDALAAAFRGEADPIERFGLSLKVSDINAKALALGLAESTSEITKQAKSAAFMALVMEQTGDIQGQFARESDTVAVQVQKARASMENISAEMGRNLLPMAERVLGFVNDLFNAFSRLPDGVKTAIVVLAGVTAGLASILLLIPPLIAGITALGAISNVALAGIPIAIAAIVAGIALLIAKWDEVSAFFRTKAGLVVAALVPMIGIPLLIAANFEKIKEAARTVFNFISDTLQTVIDWFNKVISAMNKVAGVFGQEIPEIEVQLTRWERATESVGETTEQVTARIERALLMQQNAFSDTAEVIEQTGATLNERQIAAAEETERKLQAARDVAFMVRLRQGKERADQIIAQEKALTEELLRQEEARLRAAGESEARVAAAREHARLTMPGVTSAEAESRRTLASFNAGPTAQLDFATRVADARGLTGQEREDFIERSLGAPGRAAAALSGNSSGGPPVLPGATVINIFEGPVTQGGVEMVEEATREGARRGSE